MVTEETEEGYAAKLGDSVSYLGDMYILGRYTSSLRCSVSLFVLFLFAQTSARYRLPSSLNDTFSGGGCFCALALPSPVPATVKSRILRPVWFASLFTFVLILPPRVPSFLPSSFWCPIYGLFRFFRPSFFGFASCVCLPSSLVPDDLLYAHVYDLFVFFTCFFLAGHRQHDPIPRKRGRYQGRQAAADRLRGGRGHRPGDGKVCARVR